MADEQDPSKVKMYKVTQKIGNVTICKVFSADGAQNALSDLLIGVDETGKTVQVAPLFLNPASVNLQAFFKSGGMLFSNSDIS